MADARSAGVSVSAAQLERWRAKGLLPRATRAWRGRYGSQSALPEGSLELAIALGRRSRRGQDWSELAILAWLDGAPVKDSLLSGALRKAVAYLVKTGHGLLLRELEQNPVPEGWSLGPDFDVAEAATRLVAGTKSTALNRQLRARLKAAGYQDIPEVPLAGMFIGFLTGETPDDAMVEEWTVALGLNSLGSPAEAAEARHGALGLLIGSGMRELTGMRVAECVEEVCTAFMGGGLMIGAQELRDARSDLVWCLDALQVPDKDRRDPAGNPSLGQTVGMFCLVWALVRRSLPEGYGMKDVAKCGARALQGLAGRLGEPLALAS